MSYYNKSSDVRGGYDENYDLRNTGGYRDEPANGQYGGGNGGYGQNNASYASVGQGSQYPMSGPGAVESSAPYYNQSPKKKRNKWLWIGLPVLLAVIILGAVLGGVLGSRGSGNDNNSSNGSSGSNNAAADPSGTNRSGGSGSAGVGSTATGANGQAYLAISTDSNSLPVYPTATATSGYAAPTAVSGAAAAWPTDPESPSATSPRAHPRLLAPAYKWQALRSGLIAQDPYLTQWNQTIMANAQTSRDQDELAYNIDGGLGGSGVLDIARELKVRVKDWAYAYQMTNDTAWVDRTYRELQNAAGVNGNFGEGNTRWNPQHFLDVAEFCAAYAIAYDWLHSVWSDEQKTEIRGWIVTFGLSFGQQVYNGTADSNTVNTWWTGSTADPIAGNWNCVINGGLTMAALAIVDEDTTGTAQAVLGYTADNAKTNCFAAVRNDGTWAETSDYWYFGTTGAAEMVSAFITAYGDDQGLLESAPQWNLTSMFHIYNQGLTSKFNYGDNGPNKFSATANSLFLWAEQFNEPRYALYQRDHADAAEPWSMFWYNPSYEGAWWANLPLDRNFDDERDAWASMRSSWTESDGTFIAMRSGLLTGHQTHGDLDIGDFVIDALGQRWAGEYGSGQYLSTDYFASEAQGAARWTYYTKATEGQNTLMRDNANQLVSAQATHNFGSTGESQGVAPGYEVPAGSSAFYSTDMSSAYSQGTFNRGLRFINSRKQILLQDDVSGAGAEVQWRMQTNATISIDSAGTTATLELGGQSLEAKILSPSSGATFAQADPVKLSSDPASPPDFVYNGVTYDGNPEHPGVKVLTITMASGTDFSLQVLFNPVYSSDAGVSLVTPPNVAVTEWTATSHNS